MNSAKRIVNISKAINSFSRDKFQRTEWVVRSLQLQPRCHFCHLRQGQGQGTTSLTLTLTGKKKGTYSLQRLSTSSSAREPKENQPWTLGDSACPQGVQGDIEHDDTTFKLWLNNCYRYGLANCDQQLEGIQSGRKTIGEVIAEQESLIADIAQEYRKRNSEMRKLSTEGAQDAELLPDISTPCPQGIQGEDCARFKMWLENCHQFRFGNCLEQLGSYEGGRKTLVQIFEEQDQVIKEVAQAMYQKRMTANKDDTVEPDPSVPLSARQKLQNAVKVYGSTVIVFHVSISLMSLGFFYTLVSSGVDVVGLLSRIGIGESITQNRFATGTGTFVVAYAVHKVFAPARIAATLTATPLLVRYFRRIGFLKTPPKK